MFLIFSESALSDTMFIIAQLFLLKPDNFDAIFDRNFSVKTHWSNFMFSCVGVCYFAVANATRPSPACFTSMLYF